MIGIIVDGDKIEQALDMLVDAGQNTFEIAHYPATTDVHKIYTIKIPIRASQDASIAAVLQDLERNGVAVVVTL